MNFETFMDTLCIELGLPLTADFNAIIAAVRRQKRDGKLVDLTDGVDSRQTDG